LELNENDEIDGFICSSTPEQIDEQKSINGR
jgi:hypothetical protein